jgi:hypothetical protein
MLGVSLSGIAWGGVAGASPAELAEPAEAAKEALRNLGSTYDLAPTVDPVVARATGVVRTVSTVEFLVQIHDFQSAVIEPLSQALSARKRGALGVGYHLWIARILTKMASESPREIKDSVLGTLNALRDAARPFPSLRMPIDLLLLKGRAAQDHADFAALRSEVMNLSASIPAELGRMPDDQS